MVMVPVMVHARSQEIIEMVVVPIHVLVHVPLVLDVLVLIHVHVLLVVDAQVRHARNLHMCDRFTKRKKALDK